MCIRFSGISGVVCCDCCMISSFSVMSLLMILKIVVCMCMFSVFMLIIKRFSVRVVSSVLLMLKWCGCGWFGGVYCISMKVVVV